MAVVTPAQFVAEWKPWAQKAASELGLPWQWVLAQWGLESGFGTAPASTPAAQNLARNNPADLGGPGAWLGFSSPEAFVQAYVTAVRRDYAPGWKYLSPGADIGLVLAAPQQPGWSYYGTEPASEYASSLRSALATLVQLAGVDTPVSLTEQEVARLKSLATGRATVADAPVSAQVLTSTPSASSAPSPGGLLGKAESWASNFLGRILTALLGLALVVVGLWLASRQQEVTVRVEGRANG